MKEVTCLPNKTIYIHISLLLFAKYNFRLWKQHNRQKIEFLKVIRRMV